MTARSALLAVVSAAALACSNGGDPGPVGPAGDTGPTGTPAPSARQLLVKTATGEVIGPIAGGVVKGSPHVSQVAGYVLGVGRLALLDVQTGVISANAIVVYQSADCSGPPFASGEASVELLSVNGSRLFVLTGSTPVTVNTQSTLKDGGCITLVTTSAFYPAQELVDPRYPYAGPLQLSYE
jgi:hypothetical protein